MTYLFEVSWEVCNKVGGIYTLIRSKIPQALKHHGDNYYLLGPLRDTNPELTETDEPEWDPIRKALDAKGLKYRVGRWDVGGNNPRVILVDFTNRYDVSKVLFKLWEDFGIDSYAAQWDYVEPVIFSLACGEAIEAIAGALADSGTPNVIAHFHEWMCGAGLLYLKKNQPGIATVFTTHATVLGRALSGAGVDIYSGGAQIQPVEDAKSHGVLAKHSMEVASAREADIFTTVSDTTAREGLLMLNRRANHVIYNGLNVRDTPDYARDREKPDKTRGILLDFARKFTCKNLPDNTRFFVISGRYEYRNKGVDVFLSALAELEKRLKQDPPSPPVVAWILMAGGHKGVSEELYSQIYGEHAADKGHKPGIATHLLWDEHHDPTIQACHKYGFHNGAENKVNIIFCPAYLNGHDGLINIHYYDILAACDLGVFPSFYEPWGYTPHESISFSVPAVTTDVAGFGMWVKGLGKSFDSAVKVLNRQGKSDDETVRECTSVLYDFCVLDDRTLAKRRRMARKIALRADWAVFYELYVEAYNSALRRALERQTNPNLKFTPFIVSSTSLPKFRALTVLQTLPKELEKLQELAYNLWWSWHPDAVELFSSLDPALWESTGHNPVKMLNKISTERLQQEAGDPAFVGKFKKIYSAFSDYMKDESLYHGDERICSRKRPIAYFSMEYGIHESLPIYSGGLGILSGDHLKEASDLNIPLVAVGLFYKEGYFTQLIDRKGEQTETYLSANPADYPVKPVKDKDGRDIRIPFELPNRTAYARAWEVGVGRTRLFLLDTDIADNIPHDRGISLRLYGGDRKTRIKQEILLGIGGVRLLKQLGIEPSLYHLNEGHCAFLLLERYRDLVKGGVSPADAKSIVRASSVFTTHTPIPAGNEVFDEDLMRHYFSGFESELQMTWDLFMDLGRDKSASGANRFSMTVLALRLTSKANAVSKQHGKVSRSMWAGVWPDLFVEDIPITSVTNGVHLPTWVGSEIRKTLDKHLNAGWDRHQGKDTYAAKIKDIPDKTIWRNHIAQKSAMIEYVKKNISRQYIQWTGNTDDLRRLVEGLNPEAFTIGFAKRFASYKRPNLLFQDVARLKSLLQSQRHPVQVIFAGKAHPADTIGKNIIRDVVAAARSPDFWGKVLFIEDYDINLARYLVQGVDLWLNVPIPPNEASGTSGMKAAANGVISLSTLDGWWCEGYSPEIGWAVVPARRVDDQYKQDQFDNLAMMDALEREIIPMYYDRNSEGIPQMWVRKMKSAMRIAFEQFCTRRMLKEYWDRIYVPSIKRRIQLLDDDSKGLRELNQWKHDVRERFSDLRVLEVSASGMDGELLHPDNVLNFSILIGAGRMKGNEIRVELIIGEAQKDQFTGSPDVIPFELDHDGGTTLRYSLSYRIEKSGSYSYGIRILPFHPLLSHPQETGLIVWV